MASAADALSWRVWSDARAYDGTATIMQPLIAPLYQGKALTMSLSILLGEPNRGGYEIVQRYWRHASDAGGILRRGGDSWLNDGVIAGYRAPSRSNSVDAAHATPPTETASRQRGGMEIIFRPDPASGTAATPTTAGCRNCPSRSPSSPGTTLRS